MPILIKDYNWHQTENYITIKLPLKNVHQKNVDFLTSKQYIKASYPPYFFELFLLKPIDETKSCCFIKDDEIIFELFKEEAELWEHLEALIDKKEKIELKKKYLEELQSIAQKKDEEKENKNAELKRQAVREQMKIDTEFHNKIDDIKKTETTKALNELRIWEDKITEVKDPVIDDISLSSSAQLEAIEGPSEPVVIVPLPRKPQTVTVTFTPRAFPTPSRSSKAEEEQQWLAKQAEARRISGFVDEDLRPEERNPQWLKDKGDEFFKAGNYLAAISAYTTGIKLSKQLAVLYVNRSAAQFCMNNLHRCIQDCSTALDLMTPICEANRKSRAKCCVRRGAALCKLGMTKQGKCEMEAGARLIPKDDPLKALIIDMELHLEENLGLD